MYNPIFTLTARNGKSRAGIIHTPHGSIETPVFMPVATKGTVKTLSSEDLKELGAKMIISNSLHLYLRPGLDMIEKFGSLHNFMNYSGAIFTDSGGFQVIKEHFFISANENGINFRSPMDGKRITLTPEMSANIQDTLGSDVAMALDYCIPYGNTKRKVERAVKLTYEWAKRFHASRKGIMFGIVQGGVFKDLREISADQITSIDFHGYAIGGLSIGEPKETMYDILEYTIDLLPEQKPRYFMGLGSPLDLIKGVMLGIDVFDSVFPTRNARHGMVFTSGGMINLRNSIYKFDKGPIDEKCDCFVCKNYSRSYLHHLLREKELLALRLLSYHNVHYTLRLMERIREEIKNGNIEKLYSEIEEKYNSRD